MRAFINEILAFIDSESLTDIEFGALPEGLTEEYTRAVYDAMQDLLQGREGVSGQLKKLKAFFIAKGVDLSATPSRDASSQIFVGAALN